MIYVINFKILIKGRSKKDTYISYVIMSCPLSYSTFTFSDKFPFRGSMSGKLIAPFTRKSMRILIREFSYTIMKFFLIELAVERLSCSSNFPRASYLDERTLTYEPIVN